MERNDVYVSNQWGGSADPVGVVGLTGTRRHNRDECRQCAENLTQKAISETFAVDNRAPTLVSILLDGGKQVSPTDADTLLIPLTYKVRTGPQLSGCFMVLVTGTTAN